MAQALGITDPQGHADRHGCGVNKGGTCPGCVGNAVPVEIPAPLGDRDIISAGAGKAAGCTHNAGRRLEVRHRGLVAARLGTGAFITTSRDHRQHRGGYGERTDQSHRVIPAKKRRMFDRSRRRMRQSRASSRQEHRKPGTPAQLVRSQWVMRLGRGRILPVRPTHTRLSAS